MHVHVVRTLDGELVWISDPIEEAHHDVLCLDESGVLQMLDPPDWTGDKGYVGQDMFTPVKKINGGEPLDRQKNLQQRQQQHLRSHHRACHRPPEELQNPPHRLPARPIKSFATIISTVIGLPS